MKATFAVAIALLICAVPALAQQKSVPVMVRAVGDLDTCGVGETTATTAVRRGPSTGHAKIETIERGTRVWVFDEKNGWVGVAYGSDEIECSPVKASKPYDGPGKSGWLPKKDVRLLAG